MNKFFASLALSFFAIVGCLTLVTPLQPAYAADAYGLEKTKSLTQFKSVNKKLPELIGSIVSVALSLVGFVFLALALYAGFKWMTARGNEKDVIQAKDTLVNATIGIILIVAAYAITNFLFTDVITQIN
jgi:hypothetical protein